MPNPLNAADLGDARLPSAFYEVAGPWEAHEPNVDEADFFEIARLVQAGTGESEIAHELGLSVTLVRQVIRGSESGRLACMTDSEWHLWSMLNAELPPAERQTPCHDCTPEYAKAERKAGRCDSRPKGADPRKVRRAISNKWDDPEWATKRRAQMAEAARARNAAGGTRNRTGKYDGIVCSYKACRQAAKTKGMCIRHYKAEWNKGR